MSGPPNPYQLYSAFLEKSTSLNRVLYSIKQRWSALEIPVSVGVQQ